VKQALTRISEHLKRNGITVLKMYEMMDLDKNGTVDRDEFVTTMARILQIPGLDMRSYAMIFNQLDINNDNHLSLNEFGMFIEGAKMDKL
jgi:calmodulin